MYTFGNSLGMVCHGVPEVVICNGRVVVHHDTIRVVKGSGRYLKNPVSPQFVYARLQAQRKVHIDFSHVIIS